MWKSKIVRKLNETDANDDGDDDVTPHFTACVATGHRAHSQVHPLRARIIRCREASYTAITLNPESNFTRREKNHSLFH